MGAEHLLQIVNDLLDLEQCQRGLLVLDYADIDASALLFKAIDAHRPAISAGRLDFTVEIPRSLPPVRADGARLRQVVDTLLSNAIRHTPGGGRVFLTAMVKNGCLHLSVTDTGMGIEETERQNVFQQFPEPGLKKARSGSNALALARYLVELHGGKISIEIQSGKENVFRFNLPVSGPNPAVREQ